MGILGRYDERSNEIVPATRGAQGGVWRYDDSSDEESGENSSEQLGSKVIMLFISAVFPESI